MGSTIKYTGTSNLVFDNEITTVTNKAQATLTLVRLASKKWWCCCILRLRQTRY